MLSPAPPPQAPQPQASPLHAPAGVLPPNAATLEQQQLRGCAFRAPLVQPRGSDTAGSDSSSVIVYHARAVYESWAGLAEWLARREGGLAAQAGAAGAAWKLRLFRAMVALGDQQVRAAKQVFAPELPTFLASYEL